MLLRRWVTASVVKELTEAGHPMVFGLYKQNTPETDGLNAGELRRVEFRLDGPTTVRFHLTERHFFNLNWLITHSLTPNVYALDEYMDTFRNAVEKDYCIYEIDDAHQEAPFEHVGHLEIIKRGRDTVNSHNFGVTAPNKNIAQAVVKARFYMDLPKI